jgi:MFS family permease
MAEKGFNKWIITVTVILASLLELIDTTVVNVSTPQIMGNLGATLEDAGWLVTAYAVANVIILPMSGWQHVSAVEIILHSLLFFLPPLLFSAVTPITSGSSFSSVSFRVLVVALS